MLSLKDECPKIQCVSFRCPEHCTYQGITQQRQLLKRQDCRARASNKIKTNNISNKIEKKQSVVYFMSLSQHLPVVNE
jgi:hypothetical protein